MEELMLKKANNGDRSSSFVSSVFEENISND